MLLDLNLPVGHVRNRLLVVELRVGQESGRLRILSTVLSYMSMNPDAQIPDRLEEWRESVNECIE